MNYDDVVNILTNGVSDINARKKIIEQIELCKLNGMKPQEIIQKIVNGIEEKCENEIVAKKIK